MPKGSSRAYLKHVDRHETTVDGKPVNLETGTKVAIKAQLDKYHHKSDHDGMSLGELQNKTEGGDHWINRSYRILTKNNDDKGYSSNKEAGIFPPLIDHDHEHHTWTHVGHARDLKGEGEFRKLTKSESHPEGLSHRDFCDALERQHNRNNGKHWEHPQPNLDKADEHPLVQKFNDYHGNTGHPPHDYRQIKNMGVFEHPDGSKHIITRDHGFDSELAHTYQKARKNVNSGHRDKLGGY